MQESPVKAQLKFLANLDGPLVYIPSKGDGDETEHVGNYAIQEVGVRDGRGAGREFDLDTEGLDLVQQKADVRDFYDDIEVATIYHGEVKALLKKHTGADRVEIFDDTRRTS